MPSYGWRNNFLIILCSDLCKMKMRLPMKLMIGSLVALVFIVVLGFIVFPKFLTGKIKSMVNLAPGTEIRGMFLDVPFGLSFKIYMFNVTNPMEVQGGAKPIVKEVGPFCYEEWKKKINVEDSEADDMIFYNPVDTFYKAKGGRGCKTGKEMITIPHPMILGVVNAVVRQKPGALSLVNKAIKSVYRNPQSIFLTASADDILFDGVIINCDVKDFAGKAICSQLKEADALKRISEDELAFSLVGPKNGTAGKQHQALRGTRNFHDVGRIVKYDGAETISTWPTDECNKIDGTDGTIFPPFLTKEEGLVSFAPDLCRSLAAYYVKDTKYDGIPVRKYSADLGDMSTNENEKCYCYTPETCLKKGVMDLYKCVGVPIYASLPHFYNCHQEYLNGVKGLTPNEKEHEIIILFEPFTGGPVAAKKRLQFSMPLEPNEKVDLFKNFTPTLIPMFWVEEGVDLNNTFTKPLKQLFTMKKIVNISKWLILVASLAGMAASGYLFYKKEEKVEITPVQKVKSDISMVHGQENLAMSNNEIDKY